MKKEKKIIALVILVAIIIVIGVNFGFFDKITGNVIAEKGLVAHYSFENNVNDITGNGHDALGVPYAAKYDYGRVGLALDFDKEGTYVIIRNKESLNLQEFTLSFWTRLNDPMAIHQGGIVKGVLFSHPGDFSYTMEFSRGNIKAAITNIQNEEFKIKAPVGDDSWHFWLMSVGNGKLALYKDGVTQGVTDYNGEIDYAKKRNDLAIGTSTGPNYLFDGKIDELKILNHALTEEDAWNEYNSYSKENYCGDGVCDSIKESIELCMEDCSCKDSDGGFNYYEKGTCREGEGGVITDSCGGDKWLNEAHCEGSKCKIQSQGCAYGCSDGACLGTA